MESIRLVFSDNLQKVAKITNLFNSHFSSIMLLHYHIEDVAENILTFIKETYYFRCISDGKYTFMTAQEIIQNEFILTYEAMWEHGNDDYLDELSHSGDFDKSINYVILAQDDISIHNFDKGIAETFLYRIFKRERVIPLAEIMKFERISVIDKILSQWWILVKFSNYKSDNIMEEFYDKRVLKLGFHHYKLK